MEHIGRIKVIEPCKLDEMYSVCICPHCGKKTTYGEMAMVSGIHCCHHCLEELNKTIEFDKKTHYEVYARKANNHEYEPYRYRGDE